MSTDAIVLLKDDHTQLRRLFREFEGTARDDTKAQASLVGEILSLLTVHTYLENEVVYPGVRELLPDVEQDVLESYEEHHVADVLSLELAAMSPNDERYNAKAMVLIEGVRHHMDEEEQDWFPKVRAGLGRSALQEMGARMIDLRPDAPTSPAQPSNLKKAVDSLLS